jgi:hypothetical protein
LLSGFDEVPWRWVAGGGSDTTRQSEINIVFAGLFLNSYWIGCRKSAVP